MNDLLKEIRPAGFAPMLYLKTLAPAIEFYKKAFGAIELRTITNSDGSVHVSEMAIGRSLFRMHEEVTRDQNLSPATLNGTTVVLGLLVDDPDVTVRNAVAAGAKEINPVQDYEYGYRQGTIEDPFGHHWMIEKIEMI
jgi:PhnB protein